MKTLIRLVVFDSSLYKLNKRCLVLLLMTIVLRFVILLLSDLITKIGKEGLKTWGSRLVKGVCLRVFGRKVTTPK